MGWHPMYHIFCGVLLLHSVLPPFPWTHNKEEARNIGVAIYNMQKAKQICQTIGSVLILNLFMFTWILQPYVTLFREGTRTTSWNGLD
jgi:hypothetical protein